MNTQNITGWALFWDWNHIGDLAAQAGFGEVFAIYKTPEEAKKGLEAAQKNPNVRNRLKIVPVIIKYEIL